MLTGRNSRCFRTRAWRFDLAASSVRRRFFSMSLTTTTSKSTRERWRTAGRFADVLEAEVKNRRNPFIVRVVTWLNLCRLCQDLEEQMLMAPQPESDDLPLHRTLL